MPCCNLKIILQMSHIPGDPKPGNHIHIFVDHREARVQISIGEWSVSPKRGILDSGWNKNGTPQSGEIVSVCQRLAIASRRRSPGPVTHRTQNFRNLVPSLNEDHVARHMRRKNRQFASKHSNRALSNNYTTAIKLLE